MSDDEIAQSLTAAERLSRLQELEVPTDFAARLERSLRARVRTQSRLQHSGKLASNRGIVLIAGRRRPARARRPPKRRGWIVLLGTAAALVFSFISLFAFSTQSLPGDPLYGLKEVRNQFTLAFESDPQIRAHSDLAFLQSALDDLRTVVADRRGDDALTLALNTVADRTNECRRAVAALPTGSQRTIGQQDLTNVLTQEDQTVRQLLNQVDWPMRVLFTQQLGALGDPVPTMTHVTVLAQSNGTLLITLTGTHFASQAVFVLNGRPVGTVNQVTLGQLVAIIQTSQWGSGPHAFGVLNPDGTAAQKVFKEDGDGDDNNEPGGIHSPSGTPVTPTSDGDSDD